MRLLIAGSRNLEPDLNYLDSLIKSLPFTTTCIVSGGAKGVDTQAELWAKQAGLQHVIFYPGWLQHGKKYAGYVRNMNMADYADALLAIWDGKSPGTKHMINEMKARGKPVHVY